MIMHGHTIYPRLGGIIYESQTIWWRKILQKILRATYFITYPLILTIRFFIEQRPNLIKLQRPIIENKIE